MADVLLGGLRLAHALAAATWVGAAIVYVLVPAGSPQRSTPPVFREVFAAGVAVFVVSGVILAFQRLSSAALPPSYVALLALKTLLGLGLFVLVRPGGSPRVAAGPWWTRREAQVALLGAIIYALAIGLRNIYEETLRG